VVVAGDHEQQAVVLTLGAQLPGLGDPDRKVLDRLSLERWDEEELQLYAVAVVLCPRRPGEVLERRAIRRGEQVRFVDDRAGERRDRQLARGEERQQRQRADQNLTCGAFAAPSVVAVN
jgi:hypothetical protein